MSRGNTSDADNNQDPVPISGTVAERLALSQ